MRDTREHPSVQGTPDSEAPYTKTPEKCARCCSFWSTLRRSATSTANMGASGPEQMEADRQFLYSDLGGAAVAREDDPEGDRSLGSRFGMQQAVGDDIL